MECQGEIGPGNRLLRPGLLHLLAEDVFCVLSMWARMCPQSMALPGVPRDVGL